MEFDIFFKENLLVEEKIRLKANQICGTCSNYDIKG